MQKKHGATLESVDRGAVRGRRLGQFQGPVSERGPKIYQLNIFIIKLIVIMINNLLLMLIIKMI